MSLLSNCDCLLVDSVPYTEIEDEGIEDSFHESWVCTREPDHDGNHVGGSGYICEDPEEIKAEQTWIEWNEQNGLVGYDLRDGDGPVYFNNPTSNIGFAITPLF